MHEIVESISMKKLFSPIKIKELSYKLKKELWAFTDNRIAVRFEYEYHNKDGQWFRAYGNENWEFDENWLIRKRYASINDWKAV